MQAVFIDNWVKTTGTVLHGDDYFPTLQPAGEVAAQMFSSSPSGGSESMHLMYLLAITARSTPSTCRAQQRPFAEKLLEHAASLLGPQL